jgi:DNA repair protein RAD5
LDLIEIALQREHFDQYRFDGSMELKKRNNAISRFQSPSRKPKVLIISLKAGGKHESSCSTSSPKLIAVMLQGVGLNLTSANHVFMVNKNDSHADTFLIDDFAQMDCWWNSAVESQGKSSIGNLPALSDPAYSN